MEPYDWFYHKFEHKLLISCPGSIYQETSPNIINTVWVWNYQSIILSNYFIGSILEFGFLILFFTPSLFFGRGGGELYQDQLANLLSQILKFSPHIYTLVLVRTMWTACWTKTCIAAKKDFLILESLEITQCFSFPSRGGNTKFSCGILLHPVAIIFRDLHPAFSCLSGSTINGLPKVLSSSERASSIL